MPQVAADSRRALSSRERELGLRQVVWRPEAQRAVSKFEDAQWTVEGLEVRWVVWKLGHPQMVSVALELRLAKGSKQRLGFRRGRGQEKGEVYFRRHPRD